MSRHVVRVEIDSALASQIFDLGVTLGGRVEMLPCTESGEEEEKPRTAASPRRKFVDPKGLRQIDHLFDYAKKVDRPVPTREFGEELRRRGYTDGVGSASSRLVDLVKMGVFERMDREPPDFALRHRLTEYGRSLSALPTAAEMREARRRNEK